MDSNNEFLRITNFLHTYDYYNFITNRIVVIHPTSLVDIYYTSFNLKSISLISQGWINYHILEGIVLSSMVGSTQEVVITAIII
jgi:hypothetical protein